MTRDNEFALVTDESIHFSSQFDCSQTELWHAIVDPRSLSAWLGGPSFIEPEVGGNVLLRLAEQSDDATGVVRICDPPRPGYRVALLEHTFVAGDPPVTSICRWAVRATASGSELLFTHDGAGIGNSFAGAWTRLIGERARLQVARDLLSAARTVLLVSFIGPEVPTTLIEAGFDVIAKVGPEPDAWAACSLRCGALQFEPRGAPVAIDLLHLDVADAFEEYLDVAGRLGAKTFWYHSARTQQPAPHDDRGCWLPAAQSDRQRRAVEAAGLAYVDDVYIADIARELTV